MTSGIDATGTVADPPLAEARRPIRIGPGLHLIAGARVGHAHDANAYLVSGTHEALLVDCGSPGGAPGLLEGLTRLGVGPGDLSRVIGTHGHHDHVGGAAALAALGVPLWLHPADRDAVESGDPDRTAAFLYREPFPATAVAADLADGDRIDLGGIAVEIVHAPGHTPGSVAVLVTAGDRRILLAGDVLWGGFHPRIGSDLDAWDASLARLEALDPDDLTWGHGPPYLLPDGGRRIAEARRQLGVYFDPWFKPPGEAFIY